MPRSNSRLSRQKRRDPRWQDVLSAIEKDEFEWWDYPNHIRNRQIAEWRRIWPERADLLREIVRETACRVEIDMRQPANASLWRDRMFDFCFGFFDNWVDYPKSMRAAIMDAESFSPLWRWAIGERHKWTRWINASPTPYGWMNEWVTIVVWGIAVRRWARDHNADAALTMAYLDRILQKLSHTFDLLRFDEK